MLWYLASIVKSLLYSPEEMCQEIRVLNTFNLYPRGWGYISVVEHLRPWVRSSAPGRGKKRVKIICIPTKPLAKLRPPSSAVFFVWLSHLQFLWLYIFQANWNSPLLSLDNNRPDYSNWRGTEFLVEHKSTWTGLTFFLSIAVFKTSGEVIRAYHQPQQQGLNVE